MTDRPLLSLCGICKRIAVMHEGKITGVLEREHCNEENVMNLAVGKTIAAAKSAVN
jgi:ribose transport system ATP-binding protein